MSKTVASREDWVKKLDATIVRRAESVLKRSTNKQIKTTQVAKRHEAEMKAYAKKNGITLLETTSTEKALAYHEEAWQAYIRACEGILKKKPLPSAKAEFYTHFFARKLDLLGVDPSFPAYFGGDIDTDAGLRVQQKASKARFKVGYKLGGLSRMVSTYAGRFDPALIDNILDFLLNFPELEKRKSTITEMEFIQEYLTFSAADWYLFRFTGLGFSLSVRSDELPGFVQAYPDMFEFKKASSDPFGKQLQFTGYPNDTQFWRMGLRDSSFFIHHAIPQVFYDTRGTIRGGTVKPSTAQYGVSEIKAYNAKIDNDFWDIHNSFFGGIPY